MLMPDLEHRALAQAGSSQQVGRFASPLVRIPRATVRLLKEILDGVRDEQEQGPGGGGEEEAAHSTGLLSPRCHASSLQTPWGEEGRGKPRLPGSAARPFWSPPEVGNLIPQSLELEPVV